VRATAVRERECRFQAKIVGPLGGAERSQVRSRIIAAVGLSGGTGEQGSACAQAFLNGIKPRR
jgi:uncharacterized protein GlcG (DUF336 family)